MIQSSIEGKAKPDISEAEANTKIAKALIQIDDAGLQRLLEALMWEILSAVQVRVTEQIA